MELRPYQREAISALLRYFDMGNQGNPLIVAPTGAGKSVIIAELMKQLCTKYAHDRFLILSHRKEILSQNANKIYRVWPEAPLGIYSAGLRSRRVGRITIAGIQSVHRRADIFGPLSLIIIDEAHLLPRKGEGMYLSFLAAARKQNPNVRMVGLTATPYRLDSGVLIDGPKALFTDIVYNIPIHALIEDGFLVPLVSKSSVAQANLSAVRLAGREYIAGEAEAAMDVDELTQAAIKEMLKFAHDRQSWLIFCAGVQHVQHVTAALQAWGIEAKGITGDSLPWERDQAINAFAAGKLRALINCEVLTTGFDAPCIDMIASLRPTQSPGLWVQMCGRGMRPAARKQNCLVLDFAGNIERHGPLDKIVIKNKKDGSSEVDRAPVKICPECRTALHTSLRECPECGYLFEMAEPQHAPTASNAEVMSSGLPEAPEPFDVFGVEYCPHRKRGGLPSMRVDYRVSQTQEISEWICFEHGGFAAEKARQWWKSRQGLLPVPESVEEALERTGELNEPSTIWVQKQDKYFRIVSVNFKTVDQRAQDEEFRTWMMEEIGI